MPANTSESRLRSRARRLGLMLQKSRAAVDYYRNFGEFRVFDPHQRVVVAGMTYDLDLDDVAAFLADYAE